MTIKEIAKLAGVSISTVSKIVNNKDQNINSETRNRVLKIVKEYNYTPYGTVKNISTAKTFLIGVLLNDMNSSGRMLDGILEAAQKKGYCLLLLDSRHSLSQELKHITALCINKIDGLLWEPVSADSLQHAHYFSDAGIPVVQLNTPLIPDACTINYQRLGYLCTEKMIQWQHSRIGCLLKEDDERSQQVYEGFKACLFDHHLSQFDGMALYLSDTSCVSHFMAAGITGIVSSYFGEALALYSQLHRLHYQIPSDFSLVSLCSDNRGTVEFPAITRLEIPFRELGYQACQSLIGICEKTEEDFPPVLLDSGKFLDSDASLQMPPALRSGKFLVLGSINADVTLTVDGFPETGKSTLITNSSSCAGGKGTNQSVGAALLGHEAVLLGKVGNDADANLILETLNQNHLSTEGIIKDSTAQTGKAYVYLQKSGEVTITYIPGANLKLTPEDIRAQKAILESCQFCLISMDIPVEAAIEAAILAKKLSVRTILKPSALSSLPEVFYQTTDIFVPNQQEAATFCPQLENTEEQAEYFYKKGIPVVIITLGHSGCYVRAKHLKKYFSASNFEAVDATGGADAFISALAVHLSEGYSLENSIQIAQYAAGFCISKYGVTTALADKESLYAYIRKTEPALLECN